MIRRKLIRAAIFLAGFGFIAGSTLFAFAWFTVSIPDPNAYVNSQSTIIQYSNGEEIGRIGSQNRQILPLAKIPLMPKVDPQSRSNMPKLLSCHQVERFSEKLENL